MLKYNGVYSGNRVHTIRVTFQLFNYIGHIAYEVSGNCAGLNVIDFETECIDLGEIRKYVVNDCKFNLDEERDIFTLELFNSASDTSLLAVNREELRKLVVCVEIVDCRPEEG